MTVQRDRMREILEELRGRGHLHRRRRPLDQRGRRTGSTASSTSIFVGEAEETWPRFLEEWARGEHQYRYEQAEKTDMTKVPLPRYDLVPFREYAMGCVQTSRGCPFQCEFCDIIVIFGRKPRIKTPEQVVAEIDAQHRLGCRVIFLVDDNFIGNKKAAKEILRAIIAWQRQHGYPLAFFTEASLDLAEDDELLRLMAEAGLVAVFIGIESPDEDALRETKKYQNVRGSLVDRVRKVQDAGLEVYAGMIVGFDNDDDDRLRPPVRIPPPVADRRRDGRHALGDPQDAALRPPRGRGPARQRGGRRPPHRHQRRPPADDPRRDARRLARPDGPALRRRELLRAVRRPVHRGQAPAGHGQDDLAPPPPAAGATSKLQALTILGGAGACSPGSGPTRGPGRIARSTRKYLAQAARLRPPAPLPVPVRLEVHHAHPLRHHDPPDGAGRVAAGQYLSRDGDPRDVEGPIRTES